MSLQQRKKKNCWFTATLSFAQSRGGNVIGNTQNVCTKMHFGSLTLSIDCAINENKAIKVCSVL